MMLRFSATATISLATSIVTGMAALLDVQSIEADANFRPCVAIGSPPTMVARSLGSKGSGLKRPKIYTDMGVRENGKSFNAFSRNDSPLSQTP